MHRERTQAGCLLRDSLVGAIPATDHPPPSLCMLLSAAILCLTIGLSGCSGSGGGETPAAPPDSIDGQLDGLSQLEDDPGLLNRIPDVVSIDIRADTGLQIAYTRQGQNLEVPGAQVELQWVHMQSCLGQQGVAPVIVIRDGPVMPFTATDDVIYNIDGIPVASSSRRDVPVIQVRDTDFDGSLGIPGFNLRSIMGRLLWLSASLPERDYPFGCASQLPE